MYLCRVYKKDSMKRLCLLLSVIALLTNTEAQTLRTVQPKRELRAAWIATVANIDWPSREAVGHSEQQKQELLAMLDTLEKLKMNAVVFQVRSTADALYYSDLEPLSHWLTGKQGEDNDEQYDPLEFVCTEAHKRCIDVHVWLNPYRVTNGMKLESLADNHIFRQHPEWFVQYGDKWYFDPALDETRGFLNNVVADIVTRYDVDAIHFDDYFYPYRIAGKEFPDDESFAANPRGYTDKNEWRRNNVNMVIEELQNTIKGIKPWVEFGISPFGVWRNESSDPARGSKTKAGCQNYDDLYADILLWLEKGWIDYVVPQLYWEIGKRVADYEVLAHWWAQYSYGKNLYIGQAPYLLGNKRGAEAWRTPNEICRQIRLNRTIDEVKGSVFFSMNSLMANKEGVCDSLQNDYYRTAAIPPSAIQRKELFLLPPVDMHLEGHVLSWQSQDTAATTHRYVVYAFPLDVQADFDDPQFIFTVTADNSVLIDEPDRYSAICVTEINRYKQESAPCILEN